MHYLHMYVENKGAHGSAFVFAYAKSRFSHEAAHIQILYMCVYKKDSGQPGAFVSVSVMSSIIS